MISPYIYPGLKKPTTDEYLSIIDEVATYFNKTRNDLKQKTRFREFVMPRQIAMTAIRLKSEQIPLKHWILSFQDVADMFGKHFDHSTVIHSMKKCRDFYTTEKNYARDVDEIFSRIGMNGNRVTKIKYK